ncbi:MAG: UvrB/UvrC motif-containing protein [Geminicoccaceae bacterium]
MVETETQAAETETEDAPPVEQPKFPSLITADEMKAKEPEKAAEGEGDEEGEDKPKETKGRPADLPKDEEWDHVEFTEEQQKRFNRVYGEMKRQEKTMNQLLDDNKRLMELAEKREAREDETARNDGLSSLQQRERDALESGDYEEAQKIRDQITDLKLEALKTPDIEPEPEPDDKKTTINEDYLSQDGREDRLIEWANETDDQNRLIRPWCDPKHVDHKQAIAAAEAYLRDPDTIEKVNNGEMTFEDVLSAIEDVNGRISKAKGRKRPAATVLPGEGNVRPGANGKIKLTEEQKAVAAKMGIDEERYAKSLQLHGTKQ